MPFSEKIVLVTGGAKGIGLAVSLAFARAGATVYSIDMDGKAGSELLASAHKEGIDIRFIRADVSLEEDVLRATGEVITAHQRIDVLINNAGIGSGHSTLYTRPMEEWDRVLAVNLRGPYLFAKYCASGLAAGDPAGVIINIASTRALMSEAHTEPYSASKGGILALTHSLAVSLGPQVRVNAISPGWIEVGDSHHSDMDRSQHPAGRVGTPQDIASACLFLSSPQAGFITGTNLVVDGGMTVKMIYEE